MQLPRHTTMMGVARALMSTLTDDEIVEIMLAEFGWDATFQVFATMRGDDAQRLFGLVWERLLVADLRDEVRRIQR